MKMYITLKVQAGKMSVYLDLKNFFSTINAPAKIGETGPLLPALP